MNATDAVLSPPTPPAAPPAPPATPPAQSTPAVDGEKLDPRTEGIKFGINEGKEREARRIARELGLETLDIAAIKAAIDAKKTADDAKKTNEQRIAELQAQAADRNKLADLLKGVVEARLKDLPEEARKLVLDWAGNDPLKQMEFMAKDTFTALAAKLTETKPLGAPFAPPSGLAAPVGGERVIAEGQALFNEAMKGNHAAREAFTRWQLTNPKLTGFIK